MQVIPAKAGMTCNLQRLSWQMTPLLPRADPVDFAPIGATLGVQKKPN